MTREEEIKVLLNYAVEKVDMCNNKIKRENNLNSRMNDHLIEMDCLVGVIKKLREEFHKLINKL